MIAVKDSTHMVWIPVFNNPTPCYTHDGATWTPCKFAGFSRTDGWGGGFLQNNHILCIDLTNTSTFYCFRGGGAARTADVIAAPPNTAGSGYSVDDVLSFVGGTSTITAQIKVTGIDGGGGITTFNVVSSGSYTGTPPINPVSLTYAGAGSGGKINVTTWGYVKGLWRSTDVGVNWTNMSGTNKTPNTADNCTIISIPSDGGNYEGHLMAGSGNTGAVGPLSRSIDAGKSWHNVPGTTLCWQVGAGKAAPGKSYPAIYFTGTCSTDLSPTDPGVFRADDVDPSNLSVTPTWVRLSRAPFGNMDTSNYIFADLETYGTWYLAHGGTGYCYGKLS
jgi:hypothetical protein